MMYKIVASSARILVFVLVLVLYEMPVTVGINERPAIDCSARNGTAPSARNQAGAVFFCCASPPLPLKEEIDLDFDCLTGHQYHPLSSPQVSR